MEMQQIKENMKMFFTILSFLPYEVILSFVVLTVSVYNIIVKIKIGFE